ncbi:hypothetical protein Hanom_Chr03g00263331 [Helianthus anomalus]
MMRKLHSTGLVIATKRSHIFHVNLNSIMSNTNVRFTSVPIMLPNCVTSTDYTSDGATRNS